MQPAVKRNIMRIQYNHHHYNQNKFSLAFRFLGLFRLQQFNVWFLGDEPMFGMFEVQSMQVCFVRSLVLWGSFHQWKILVKIRYSIFGWWTQIRDVWSSINQELFKMICQGMFPPCMQDVFIKTACRLSQNMYRSK